MTGAGSVMPSGMSSGLVALPLTVTTLKASSSTLSGLAVMVTVPVLSVSPSAIVSRLPLSVTAPAGVTSTVTIVTALDALSKRAVTVLTPPSSSIRSSNNSSLSTGAGCTGGRGGTVRAPWPRPWTSV